MTVPGPFLGGTSVPGGGVPQCQVGQYSSPGQGVPQSQAGGIPEPGGGTLRKVTPGYDWGTPRGQNKTGIHLLDRRGLGTLPPSQDWGNPQTDNAWTGYAASSTSLAVS